ncbi:MAG: NAD(P)H-hydrate epimerase [Candidatus Omnitrophota bacterium]
MFALDARTIKEIDERAQNEYAIPGLILMENAGLAATQVALQLIRRQRNKQVTVFSGPGNNGGDGFVLARHLANKKLKVKVFLLGKKNKLRGDARANFVILSKIGVEAIELSLAGWLQVKTQIKRAGLVVDAIFGIGLNKDISGIFEDVIKQINLRAEKVLALDIPSGLCATTGRIFKACVRADTTVTFGMAKKGFFKRYAKKYTGRIVVADIGLPRTLIEQYRK